MIKLFKKSIRQQDINELLYILEECKKYINSSEDSDWSEMGVNEIAEILDREIFNLKNEK